MSRYLAALLLLALAVSEAEGFKLGALRARIARLPAATHAGASAARTVTPHLRLASLRMSTTEMPKLDAMATTGMFTNSSPETKRVLPPIDSSKTKFKIVYVVLESQYQSSLTKACNAINSGKENVAVEAVGYLLEELRNPAVFEQFKQDVADANIFIGSLIFVQELADKVSVGSGGGLAR